ncbi:MAG: ferritin-like domain-containing protein [Terriglobia bacterium]
MNTKADAQKKDPFLADIEEIRRRTLEHIEKAAATLDYKGNTKTVLPVLNEALATELVCVLRCYERQPSMVRGHHSLSIRAAAEFLGHAAAEQSHADQIAERIRQLNGEPNLSPDGILTRSHSEYEEGKTLLHMLREDLRAEHIIIESYSEIIRYLGDNDPASKRVMEGILADEEEYAADMNFLLKTISKEEKQREHQGRRAWSGPAAPARTAMPNSYR